MKTTLKDLQRNVDYLIEEFGENTEVMWNLITGDDIKQIVEGAHLDNIEVTDVMISNCLRYMNQTTEELDDTLDTVLKQLNLAMGYGHDFIAEHLKWEDESWELVKKHYERKQQDDD